MRVVVAVVAVLAVMSGCSDTSPIDEPSGSDSSDASVDPVERTTDGAEATGRLTVTNRYPFDQQDLPVFPSPDGRMYLDVDGCVVPIAEDGRPACPDDQDRWVASASWAPDGSVVVHDRAASRAGGDSDIRAVFVEDPAGDFAGRSPSVQFVNLTEEGDGEEPKLDTMPLVVDGEVRFLRLSTPLDPPFEMELVTIDLDGAVIGSAPTALTTDAMVSDTSAALVDGSHVLAGTSTGNQGQLITIGSDGTTLEHPIDGRSVMRFYDTGASDAVVMTFTTGLEPTSGQIRVFDGSSYRATGLPVTERGFDVLRTIRFDPSAIALSPDRDAIVAAYSNADRATTTLRVWHEADATITEIGTIPVRAVHEMRWLSSDHLLAFGDDEILTLELGP